MHWKTLLGAFLLCAVMQPAHAGLFNKEKTVKNPQVSIQTNMGDIVIELDQEKAPKSVANFLEYVKKGHYNDTIFHRVIKTFMIQGGGFSADMKQKPTDAPVQNEADNGLKNKRGTVAMARTSDPHSATAQFFINVVDNESLNFRGKTQAEWGYAVFGRVVDGMDVVDKIRAVKTGSKNGFQDVPQETVTIEKAELLEAK